MRPTTLPDLVVGARTAIPTLETLERIAEGLGIPVHRLLVEDQERGRSRDPGATAPNADGASDWGDANPDAVAESRRE